MVRCLPDEEFKSFYILFCTTVDQVRDRPMCINDPPPDAGRIKQRSEHTIPPFSRESSCPSRPSSRKDPTHHLTILLKKKTLAPTMALLSFPHPRREAGQSLIRQHQVRISCFGRCSYQFLSGFLDVWVRPNLLSSGVARVKFLFD